MLSNKYPKEHRRHRNATTDVILLIDSSGSMQPRRDETIREVNRYLDQLKHDGLKYRLTVKTFDTYVHTLIASKDIRDVGELEHSEYRPNGWTALLDAVGETLSKPYDRRSRTLLAVITDGEENSSRHYGLQQVRDMIDDMRSEDFQFVFLGDGPSAWQVGHNLGFNYSVQTDWGNPANSANIYEGLYKASNRTASGMALNAGVFNTNSTSASNTTPEERNKK